MNSKAKPLLNLNLLSLQKRYICNDIYIYRPIYKIICLPQTVNNTSARCLFLIPSCSTLFITDGQAVASTDKVHNVFFLCALSYTKGGLDTHEKQFSQRHLGQGIDYLQSCSLSDL